MVLSVSVLTGFDCLEFQDLAGGVGRGIGRQQSYPLTFKFVTTGLHDLIWGMMMSFILFTSVDHLYST